MKVVIMAGGNGTRFWPLSVSVKPKQFLSLNSRETLIQETYRRFRYWVEPEKIYIVTTTEYLSLVREQLPEISLDHIIMEPDRRDTGPCIALTALYFLDKGEDEVLVTTPSDQYIGDLDALMAVLNQAEQIAHSDKTIATLGIVPSRPESGYGYIEVEEKPRDKGIHKVKSFIEKPSIERAEQLIQKGNVFWNSGIFVWKPSTIAYYMNLYQRDMWEVICKNKRQLDKIYSQLPKISVDYAILEKADNIYMIPVHFPWDDVGTWTSLERIHQTDSNGNILIGDIQTLLASNSIVYSEKEKTVVLGVSNLIIVSTEKGLLVCHKSEEQRIKKILETFN